MTTNPNSLIGLGQPLVTARSAELFAWGPDQVLKLFRPSFSGETARWEQINIEEAHRLGATSVSCSGAVQIEGRTGLILRRIEGGTLTSAADSNPLKLFSIPKTLAQLHAQVHAAHTDRLQDIKAVVEQCLSLPSMAFLSADQKAAFRRYLAALPDGNTLLHMDFHTDNILGRNSAETIIDWATAARGAVGADLAMTYFLFHEAELFPGISKAREMLYNTLRKFIYRRYFDHYLQVKQLDATGVMRQIHAWYLPILVCRLATWEAPTEVARLQKKIATGVNALASA